MLALALVTLLASPQGQLASAPGEPRPESLAPPRNLAFAASDPAELDGAGDLVAFSVAEQAQGQGSLNGDLDALDDVLFVADLARGTTTALGAAGAHAFVGDLAGERLLLTLSEQANGGTDLDGDGDALDFVLHVYDGAGLVDLGLAAAGVTAVGKNAIVLGLEDGQVDMNGDGDRLDTVFHLYRADDVVHVQRVGRP